MPPELNTDVEAQSSGAAQTQDVNDGVQDMAPDVADSSPAEDVAEDTLAIVQDVVGEESKDAAPDSSSEGEEEQNDAQTEDLSDEEMANLPFGKHPRFQQVLSQIKDARAQVEELTAKASQFETDAGRYRNTEAFLQNNNLTGEEAAGGLEVLALAKTNPVRAWEQIKPWVTQLATAAGAMVSPDLQKRVQEGQLSPEAARELAMANARSTAAEAQNRVAAEQAQRHQQQQAQQLIVATVSGWEQERQARDPNFGAKQHALQREVAFLQSREGKPTDAVGVKQQLDAAYAAVNQTFTPAAPKPAAKKAITPVTGGQSAGKAQTDSASTVSIIDDVMSKG